MEEWHYHQDSRDMGIGLGALIMTIIIMAIFAYIAFIYVTHHI